MQERQRQIRVCARGRTLSLWSSVRNLQWNSQWSLTIGWGRVGWNQSPNFFACPVSAQPCGLVGVNCLCMPSPCAALWVGFLLGYQLSVHIKISQHLVFTPFWKYPAIIFPFQSYPWILWSLYLVTYSSPSVSLFMAECDRCRGKSFGQERQPIPTLLGSPIARLMFSVTPH